MITAFAAALVGTFGYGAASVLQAEGASRATGPAVVRQPTYLLGLALDGLAWLASLVALRHLSLFAVQSLLAGSVAVTVLLAWAFLGARPRARDGVALVAVLVGLVGVAAAFGVQEAPSAPRWFTLAAWVGAGVVAVLLVTTYRTGAPGLLALVAGGAFAGAAVGARAIHTGLGLLDLAKDPLSWAIVVFGAVGALAYARALEAGTVGPTTAVLWVVEVLVAGLVGVMVLGDSVQHGRGALAVVSVALALGASVVLAFSPSTAATAEEPAGAPGPS